MGYSSSPRRLLVPTRSSLTCALARSCCACPVPRLAPPGFLHHDERWISVGGHEDRTRTTSYNGGAERDRTVDLLTARPWRRRPESARTGTNRNCPTHFGRFRGIDLPGSLRKPTKPSPRVNLQSPGRSWRTEADWCTQDGGAGQE